MSIMHNLEMHPRYLNTAQYLAASKLLTNIDQNNFTLTHSTKFTTCYYHSKFAAYISPPRGSIIWSSGLQQSSANKRRINCIKGGISKSISHCKQVLSSSSNTKDKLAQQYNTNVSQTVNQLKREQ